jgi:hypothetical protein
MDQIKIIEQKLNKNKIDFPNLLDNVVQKEGILAKKVSIGNFEEMSMSSESDVGTGESRLDSYADQSNRYLKRKSTLEIQELHENQEYLKKRELDLLEIKKISSQVKDITLHMQQQVQTQKEKLDSIEANVTESKQNVIKAEFEISQAEIKSRNNKKIFWICFIVSIILLSIISIIILKIIGNNR